MRFEFEDRVVVGVVAVEFGEGAFLAGVECRGELAELVEDGADRVGLGVGPVGRTAGGC